LFSVRADRRAVAHAFPAREMPAPAKAGEQDSGANARREHNGVCLMNHPPIFPAKAAPDNGAQPSYAARDAYNTRVLRWTSDMLCLWGLCGKAKCRRAQQCRGEPSDCVKRYEPIVPEDTYESVSLLRQCMERGMTFKEACAEYPDEIEEVYVWAMLVIRSADNDIRT
jgi:hypothetical protein